ncbi:beta-soluble NSF attachment protein-like isoform X2 [Lampetra planeri]
MSSCIAGRRDDVIPQLCFLAQGRHRGAELRVPHGAERHRQQQQQHRLREWTSAAAAISEVKTTSSSAAAPFTASLPSIIILPPTSSTSSTSPPPPRLLLLASVMDAASKQQDGAQLMAEADKKVKGAQSFLGGLFGGPARLAEACEIYTRAANSFKMAKNWSGAGDAFCHAARLHLQMQNKHDAAVSYVDAGNAYKKADPHEAINCLTRAIEIFTDMGRFTIAAKHHMTIAEIHESELVDVEKSMAHYEQAADFYRGEEANSTANKCLLKVAAYAAQLEQYLKAIEIYEQVGTSTMDSSLLKINARESFFKAAVCHFCVDALNAQIAVEKYEQMFPAFADSRECKFVKKLLEAHEENNLEAFTETVKEFDSGARMDQWMTTMLLRIKKTIPDDSEGDMR